ncbi:MAG: pyridoxamine 5'-phosphate oxidase [Ferruginibacter sp.]
MKNIADIRKDYKLETLNENDTDQDPIKQFEKWWNQATESNIDEVNAMTISTVGENNKPSSRIVLLKGFNEKGFIFYTNYESHKSADIKTNPNVSLVFFWKELERQVRIEGTAGKVSAEESDAYFNSRPDQSKIGAWASPQSNVIASREDLEKKEAAFKLKFAGTVIPRPLHWGGYIIKPTLIEFWQGRPGRLHDRICYSLMEENSWKKERLAP